MIQSETPAARGRFILPRGGCLIGIGEAASTVMLNVSEASFAVILSASEESPKRGIIRSTQDDGIRVDDRGDCGDEVMAGVSKPQPA